MLFFLCWGVVLLVEEVLLASGPVSLIELLKKLDRKGYSYAAMPEIKVQ